MIAVIPVRGGTLPLGADEAVAEAGGRALVVGSRTEDAARALRAATGDVGCAELGPYAPAAWSAALAPHLGDPIVILPASPDGRDLAPRLAHVLGRRLLAPAIGVGTTWVTVVRHGGRVAERYRVTEPLVATLVPGVRGVGPATAAPTTRRLELAGGGGAGLDAVTLEVSDPDPATMDLAEAPRVVAGGAGLGGAAPFAVLQEFAAGIGAAWGASRVAADAGWVPPDRFIGTTGVTIGARLYVALGISGAVQHVTGIGRPDHVIAVNTDATAPMMALADLAIVTDARALLDELVDRMAAAGA